MPEPEKIQIDLSDRTKRSLRDAQARRKSPYDHVQEIASTAVIVTFAALVITAMVYAILWLVAQFPPLP